MIKMTKFHACTTKCQIFSHIAWIITICLFGTEASITTEAIPDSKVHGANMGASWGRQDPGGPRVAPMNFAIWDD